MYSDKCDVSIGRYSESVVGNVITKLSLAVLKPDGKLLARVGSTVIYC